jgi:nitroreductase
MTFDQYFSQMFLAIFTRRSIRKYAPQPIDEKQWNELQHFINSIQVPFLHNIQISMHHTPADLSVFYFQEPPQFAAFQAPHAIKPVHVIEQAQLGFIGQLFVIYATSMGLATCWMGHHSQKAANKIVYGREADQEPNCILCTTPIGYLAEKKGLINTLTEKMWGKKQSVEEKLTPESLTTFPEPIKKALDAACQAPSAMNSQCWQFTISQQDGIYQVKINKKPGWTHFKWHYVNIDAGTSAANFWIALKAQNISPTIKLYDDGETAYWEFRIQI